MQNEDQKFEEYIQANKDHNNKTGNDKKNVQIL